MVLVVNWFKLRGMINQRVKFDHSSYRKLCEQIKKFAEQRLARGVIRGRPTQVTELLVLLKSELHSDSILEAVSSQHNNG